MKVATHNTLTGRTVPHVSYRNGCYHMKHDGFWFVCTSIRSLQQRVKSYNDLEGKK